MTTALILAYPIGLLFLWLRPGARMVGKIAGTLLGLPVFVLLVLIVLKPYWEFSGSMGDYSLDFDRFGVRDALIEKDRAAKKPGTSKPTTEMGLWTDFRGPRRDGVVQDAAARMDWKTHPPRELYRQPVGQGYASFAVVEGRAFTLEQRRKDEAVTCYDAMTGRELWAYRYRASFEEVLGGNGPRSTPTWHDGRLYALGAEGHLHCMNPADGAVVWSHNVLTEFGESNLYWGLSGSPIVVDDKLIVSTSGKDGPGIVAFDRASGAVRWKSENAGVQCYSSLMDATLAGRRMLVNLADDRINGIDPGDGGVLWSYPWTMSGGPSCSQPMVMGSRRVYLSSGYGKGAAVLEIVEESGKFTAREIWKSTRMKNKFASAVLREGMIYGLDEGVLACIDAATGKSVWKGGRYGHGSMLLVNDMLVVLSEDGQLVLARADPKQFEEIATLQIFHGRTWNNFVVVEGILLARNHKEMVAYDLR